MIQYSWAVPLLPLFAFIVVLFLGKRLPGKGAPVAIGAVALSFLMSLVILLQVVGGRSLETTFTWLTIGAVNLTAGLLIDPLAAVMLVVVTSVSLLVQIYSVGYMHGEPRFSWYFADISLFTAAMLSLVIANNYLQLYISWELVGLCSYLLIGFWYEKKAASNAAMKAFITTRVGDVGFFLGIALLFYVTTQAGQGTFEFHALGHLIDAGQLGPGVLTAAAILIFCGAVGKSAQFPLHTWLPDAMEGPTPVSALIHAATMVAAGIYLVARSLFIFEAAYPSAFLVVAVIGTITALLGATIAVTMDDIKKILAYSTISQLGFMMAVLGMGGYVAGAFHLMTHAFFKALLFLGAGSVIHGTGTQNIYEMGGLAKKMKTTTATFVIAALSIAGIFPLSGFWSKDEILAEAWHGGHYVILSILLFTAFLTAFYMFRLVFLGFFGKGRPGLHAHESPVSMTAPLVILAFPAALAGLAGAPFFGGPFMSFLEGQPVHISPNYWLMAASLAVALLGIFFAWLTFSRRTLNEARLKVTLLYRVIQNKYYLDELYQAVFVRPVLAMAGAAHWVDTRLVDSTVNQVGRVTVKGSVGAHRFDQRVIDAVVNWTGRVVRKLGERGRRAHTGYLQRYAMIIFLGFIVLAIVVYLLLRR